MAGTKWSDLATGTPTASSVLVFADPGDEAHGGPPPSNGKILIDTFIANNVVPGVQAAGVFAPVNAVQLRKLLSAVTGINTTSLASWPLTGLSTDLLSGTTYAGTLVLKGSAGLASEGLKIDFGGGSATFSTFFAAASLVSGGTAVAGTTLVTSITAAMNWSTLTNSTVIQVVFCGLCNSSGTFYPRVAQNSHASNSFTVDAFTNMITHA